MVDTGNILLHKAFPWSSLALFNDWNVKMLLPVSHDILVALQVPCVQVLPDSRARGREQVF